MHSARVSLWVVTPVNGYVDIFTLHDGSAALRICGSSAARSLKSGCEGHEMQRMRRDSTTRRLMNTSNCTKERRGEATRRAGGEDAAKPEATFTVFPAPSRHETRARDRFW